MKKKCMRCKKSGKKSNALPKHNCSFAEKAMVHYHKCTCCAKCIQQCIDDFYHVYPEIIGN